MHKSTAIIYLHELKRSLKILHRIHFNPEELHAHDETDDALDHIGTLLFLPELLQFCDELLPHCLKPEHTHKHTQKIYTYTLIKKKTPKRDKRLRGENVITCKQFGWYSANRQN